MRDVVINESRNTIGTTSNGVSVTVTSQPIVHHFDEGELGRGPAAAIRDAMRAAIEGITSTAAPATLRKREQARRALARGAAWAVERYGSQPPTSSVRLFNDSGRLAALEVLQLVDQQWAIAAPANRLDPSSFRDFADMVRRLRELAPAIANPLTAPAVREAIARTLPTLVRLGGGRAR